MFPFPWDYLLDERSQRVANIGGGIDTMRVTETVSIAKLEIRTIAGHRVLWLQTDDDSNDGDLVVTDRIVFDLAIADDGTATLKLVKGPSDPQLDALVGPHELW